MEKTDPVFSYRLANEDDKIYSTVDHNFLNIKRRFIYCQYCKFYIESNLAGAQCGKCNSNMIELLPRMNHNNEQLAGSNS